MAVCGKLCGKLLGRKKCSAIQIVGIIYVIHRLELRSKVTFLDPLPQNLLRFWHTFQLLVPEVNPLLLMKLASIDSQSEEATAGKLLRVRAGQSLPLTFRLDSNLQYWRLTNTSRSVKQLPKNQPSPKAHESLKGSHVGSQGVSISLLIPQVEWSRDRVYEEGVLWLLHLLFIS